MTTHMLAALLLASTLAAGTAAAQPAPVNQAGVTMGHWHLAAKDVEADKKLFVAMGGKLYNPGGQPLIMFPGLYITLILGSEKGEGGTVGSVVNHVGFIVDNVQMRVAQWKAAGVTVLPGGALPAGGNRLDQAFVETPDGVRIEILEDKTQTVPIRNEHIHFALPAAEISKAQAWYAKVFGGQTGVRNNAPVVNLPGVQLRFNTADTQQAPTRGRVFDHFGFDVNDHAAFVKRLEEQAVKLDQPVGKGATGNTIVYITDPWGARIEIVQRLPIGPPEPQTAQAEAPYPRLPNPPVKSPPDTTAPDIPGVVAGGTKVHLIRDMFHSTEGPIAMPDGSLLFTEQDAGDGRLIKIATDGTISTFADNTNRTIGLAYDTKGRLVGAQSNIPRIGVLYPTRSTLADSFEGLPMVAPNDLVADTKGGMYFTDTLNSRFRPTPAARISTAIVYIRPDGNVVKVSEQVERPNGISLSPDGNVLYAANGPIISAFDVQPDGSLRNFRTFATLMGGNADSMCIDNAGRLYVAAGGVQVFSPEGKHLGTIPTPLNPQAPAFAGRDKKTLYIVGGGAVYSVAMVAQGIQGRAK